MTTETLDSVLLQTDFPDLKLFASGKVRDVYELGSDRLLFVATDRISAFDYVLATGIPHKGRVLTQLSLFWFDFLKDIVPNHLVTADVSRYPKDARKLRDLSLAVYKKAADYARQKGIIIADTKFEFGRTAAGITLADEVLTPDSSRFWPADKYSPGMSQQSFDKQYVRDYLEEIRWNKLPPAPVLPAEVARRTSEKYVEAYRQLTGRPLDV